ncbi:S9 family peptidase [Alicyclobacillus ferrooxydans]|uniref:S9 family peptidase n=1 Tax=Alicyclobacillus ferrooxydans TaxID=471514 RepID=UPI000ABCAAEB|nr:prolyl oligopeptidase family serine peptidase [Alicyclobacillus ferrooxydans]
MAKQTAQYGSWKSPITSDLIVQGTISFEQVLVDGLDIYWIESRPAEGGRSVVMRQNASGQVEELTPQPFNARDRVHEYGGGAVAIRDGIVYFSNFADNHLYVRDRDGNIHALTQDSKMRYADGQIDVARGRWIGVREDHTKSDIFAENTIVAVNTDGSGETVLVSGNDFYAFPRISPDGTQLAFITWHHPNMPWDETELWTGKFAADGTLTDLTKVAGVKNESILQPKWAPNGQLYYISDESNWWNIKRITDGKLETVVAMDAEFTSPNWAFGQSDYDFIDASTIICDYTQNGKWYLAQIDTQSGALKPVASEYTSFSSIRTDGERVVFLAGSPTSFRVVVTTNVDGSNPTVLRKSSEVQVDPDYLSIPESIEFPTENGKTAHGIYYRPKNPDFTAPEGEKPPLLVHVHGGPTSAASSVLSLSTQYWTSRGVAVLDVNYGGSTGYGREYRDRLKGQWGIVDVDDAANGAKYLGEQGEVDANRLAIAGGSAGGYTTLAALTFRDVFNAGASHFGLSELEVFAQETHKFESRYMDSLLGPYPEAKDVYFNRSPINFTNQLSCPIAFFQGLDDKIVPPNQAELMVEALRKKNLPVAYLAFEGEGHGFRRAENIKRALDGEFYFYSRVFGFTPADDIEPIHIENMDAEPGK